MWGKPAVAQTGRAHLPKVRVQCQEAYFFCQSLKQFTQIVTVLLISRI